MRHELIMHSHGINTQTICLVCLRLAYTVYKVMQYTIMSLTPHIAYDCILEAIVLTLMNIITFTHHFKVSPDEEDIDNVQCANILGATF